MTALMFNPVHFSALGSHSSILLQLIPPRNTVVIRGEADLQALL